jgi:hypothetical protein
LKVSIFHFILFYKMNDLYDIPDFPNYQITKDGRVWSRYRKRFIKENMSEFYQYKTYALYCNEEKKHFTRLTHRLLALTFIPNPDNLPFVDHIDRNKTNNILSNLRWVTQSQNTINAKVTKGKSKFRHITFYNRPNIGLSYYLRIRRNDKKTYTKMFSSRLHTLEDVVKYRNEIVYPQFNIEIDD